MMHERMRGLGRIAMGLAALGLAWSCATVQETNYFALEPLPASNSPTPVALTLAVGPVDVAEYLDRPQIVTRPAANRLVVDEFNRWGGAVGNEIGRVLVSRLGATLGAQRVFAYPSRLGVETSHRLALDVHRLDGSLGGEVSLDASWLVLNERTGEVEHTERAVYRLNARGGDYAAYVAALGELLDRVAQAIIPAIRRLDAERPEG